MNSNISHQILTRTNHLSCGVHIHLYMCSCFVSNCLTSPKYYY